MKTGGTGGLEHRDCLERLAWFVSGALDRDEREAVERHLGACEACRTELARTRAVAALHAAAHPLTERLIAAAWAADHPPDSDEIEQHVAECADCREDLALARASRALESSGTGGGEVVALAPVGSAGRPARWPLALAATLAVAALTWGLLEARRGEAARLDAARLAGRLRGAEQQAELAAAARAAGERESQRVRELEREVARRRAPRAGLLLVELLPELALRAAGSAPSIELVRTGSADIALLLGLERAGAFASYTVRARRPEGGELWKLEGVRPDERGTLNLLVAAEDLPAGLLRLEVAGERGAQRSPVAAYRLLVRAM